MFNQVTITNRKTGTVTRLNKDLKIRVVDDNHPDRWVKEWVVPPNPHKRDKLFYRVTTVYKDGKEVKETPFTLDLGRAFIAECRASANLSVELEAG